MDTFTKISLRIIKEQESIIGPLAWSEASKVAGLSIINSKNGEVSFSGDAKVIIDKLVAQYERLFGRSSHEVCREAAKDLLKELKPDEIPTSLK